MFSKILSKLFCNHDFRFYRVTFGDENNSSLPNRKVEKCPHCGSCRNKEMTDKDWLEFDLKKIGEDFRFVIGNWDKYKLWRKMKMSKFETVKTLMYQYLIEDLEEQIELCNQRVQMLNDDNDLENAIYEQKQALKWEEQLKHLHKYLEAEENIYSNRPSYIEISHFDNFTNKITTDELNSMQLDGEEYYYKSSGIKLRDWRQLDEGKLYIIGNLTIERFGNVLMSKYPQETIWYELSESFDSDQRIFDTYNDKEVYIKN